jgi:hypothetical protein
MKAFQTFVVVAAGALALAGCNKSESTNAAEAAPEAAADNMSADEAAPAVAEDAANAGAAATNAADASAASAAEGLDGTGNPVGPSKN